MLLVAEIDAGRDDGGDLRTDGVEERDGADIGDVRDHDLRIRQGCAERIEGLRIERS